MCPHWRAFPAGRGHGAPAAERGRLRRGQGQRAAAGGAPRPGVAPLARDGDQVAAPRHLEEHRPASQRVTGGTQRDARHPGPAGRLIPGQFAVVAGRGDQRGVPPHRGPVAAESVRPAARHQLGGLRGPREARRSARPRRAGAPGWPEPPWRADRAPCGSACRSSPSSQSTTRPRAATGANIADRVPATMRVPPRSTVSQRRYRSAGPRPADRQTCDPAPRMAVERRVDAIEVPAVGNDDERAAARGRRGRRGAERSRPASPDRAARTRRPAATGRRPAPPGRTRPAG